MYAKSAVGVNGGSHELVNSVGANDGSSLQPFHLEKPLLSPDRIKGKSSESVKNRPL
jgi:hypothetical protein